MGESASNSRKDSLDNLLQNHCKIVHLYSKGLLGFKLENLNAILNSLDAKKFPKNLSVAILGVVGPRKIGKTLLTNFIIHSLKQGDGGWMTNIIKRSKNGEAMMERGFCWDSVSNPVFLNPPGKLSMLIGGLYLWPEPVRLVKNGGGDNDIAVWVLHLDLKDVESDEMARVLEKFMVVVCSRIMEIKWEDGNVRNTISNIF